MGSDSIFRDLPKIDAPLKDPPIGESDAQTDESVRVWTVGDLWLARWSLSHI